MKSIEDTVQEINELIVREEDVLAEIRKEPGNQNTYGCGYTVGALDVLRELRLWVMG